MCWPQHTSTSYLFVAHFATPSAFQDDLSRMSWMLINNELQRCGRKRRRPNSGTRDIWQGKPRKTTAKLSQGCRWTGLDPYNISSEYKTEESPLQYPARWFPLALRRYQTSERMPWYVMTEFLSISDTDKIHIYEWYRHIGWRNARQFGKNSPQNTASHLRKWHPS